MTRRTLLLQVVGGGVAIGVALSAQSFASAREGATTYLVQPGETLSGISNATGVPLDSLISLNDLDNPDSLTVGQQLKLATTAPSAGLRMAAQASAPLAADGAKPPAQAQAQAQPQPQTQAQ